MALNGASPASMSAGMASERNKEQQQQQQQRDMRQQ
jgi:hypothetical protein